MTALQLVEYTNLEGFGDGQCIKDKKKKKQKQS